MRVKELLAFIAERHQIYQNRMDGKPKPWTENPILRQYRFCNVYRELDEVTRWIRVNWREPHKDSPHLWFAMVVARLFNLPSTLEQLGYPEPFNSFKFALKLDNMGNQKLFNAAYIVSTNGRAMKKIDYLISEVLVPMWQNRDALAPEPGYNLYDFYIKLQNMNGMGSFMAAQVVADLKYTPIFLGCADWWTFAASGPGSRRGLNRVLNFPTASPWKERRWHGSLLELQKEIAPLMRLEGLPRMHAQDLQNCLCEFDKYERARLKEGTPKQRYPGV